ncbi:MAG: HAD family phosphatase [Desulfobacterales bacterium]|jgi:HAD superfamily hydrolase (TIGR01549 family)
MSNSKIKAIIWDYDGTLVDTRHKNFNVTKNIMQSITGTDALEFPALRSLDSYRLANRRTSNWRELYRQEFNLTEKQIDEAGRLWTEYQLADDTEISFYEGIEAIICDLAEFPHGIVSQNSRSSIAENLKKKNLLQYFKHIVGYEEVDLKKQKPEPDGLLSCMEKLSRSGAGCVCYIGDHETDVQCVRAANRALQEENTNVRIFSIGACYDSGPNTSTWNFRPDYEAQEVEDILRIVEHISHI